LGVSIHEVVVPISTHGCTMKSSLAFLVIASVAADIDVVTFDGAKGTTLSWREINDPVMGGKSTGTFTIDTAHKVGVLNGTVAIVPFLHAAGFINAEASGSTPDVSSCRNLVLSVNSATAYTGYSVSFGDAQYPGSPPYERGYKASFQAPVGEFNDVVLPFTSFSDHGNKTKCVDDPKACPTKASLQDLKKVSIFAAGVAGDVHLKVKSIRASGCTAVMAPPAGAAASAPVTLATFDNAPGTTFKWQDMNDPVMGGKSKSAFTVDDSIGHFSGTCAIVPSLQAPGFCKVATDSGSYRHPTYPHFNDASQFINGALYLEVETTSPNFMGFKVAFGAKNAINPRSHRQYGSAAFKAGFNVTGTSRTVVKVPFASFSIDWSGFTGRCDTKDPDGTQHVCCSSEHPEVCPTAQHLSQIESLEMWAEGAVGDFDLRVISIGAGPLAPEWIIV